MMKSENTYDDSATDDRAVTLQIAGGLATLTLNSPGTRNAIGAGTKDGLIEALDRLASSPTVRVALIHATGPTFCPGADLGWLRPEKPGAPERIDSLLQSLNPLLARLRELPIVFVAAVHGAVAGGGLGLMNLADIVMASSETKFSTAYTRIGATPDLGASFYLPRLLGERRAIELLLLSDAFDAARACELGLVNFVVPAAAFQQEVQALLDRLLAMPAGALASVKRLVYQSHTNSLDTQLDEERRQLVAAAGHPDFAEGIGAFLQKRQPAFPSTQVQP